MCNVSKYMNGKICTMVATPFKEKRECEMKIRRSKNKALLKAKSYYLLVVLKPEACPTYQNHCLLTVSFRSMFLKLITRSAFRFQFSLDAMSNRELRSLQLNITKSPLRHTSCLQKSSDSPLQISSTPMRNPRQQLLTFHKHPLCIFCVQSNNCDNEKVDKGAKENWIKDTLPGHKGGNGAKGQEKGLPNIEHEERLRLDFNLRQRQQ